MLFFSYLMIITRLQGALLDCPVSGEETRGVPLKSRQMLENAIDTGGAEFTWGPAGLPTTAMGEGGQPELRDFLGGEIGTRLVEAGLADVHGKMAP
jgi:hypothetical protein